MSLLALMWRFFYIGLFTIGGGQVAITLMYEPVVGGGLITPEMFYNMVAVSESTPGPIGINMATYIGCKLYGVMGGVLVTFATVLPSLIIILIIARSYTAFQEKPLVKTVFNVVRPVSAGLIAVAAWNVLKIAVVTVNDGAAAVSEAGTAVSAFPLALTSVSGTIFFAVALTLLLTVKKLSPVIVVLAGAIFGIIFM
ncbi:MAG: chromate transporter [Treponema sp.]|nr:chromate transporter [Candidatus Treponema caballi]